MGRAFESAADFAGYYLGQYDGQDAILQLATASRDGQIQLDGTFINKYREQNFEIPTYTIATDSHILENAKPWSATEDGQLALEWQYLLLHTWDIDYISGVSKWDGKPYGMAFTRQV